MADDDLLLTLSGIELAAAAVHDAVVNTGMLDPTASALVASFAEHHRAHAAAYADRLDGEGATEPDPDALEALVAPVFGAVDAASLLRGALAIEDAMAATAIDACARFVDQDEAALVARVAAVEARHQAILGVALNAPLPTDAPSVTPTDGSLLDG